MERPIRKHDPGSGKNEVCSSDHVARHLFAVIRKHKIVHKDLDRVARSSVFIGGGGGTFVYSRLSRFRCGLGGEMIALMGLGRRNRSFYAFVFGSILRRRSQKRKTQNRGRMDRRGISRSGSQGSSEDHDDSCCNDGVVANSLVQQHGLGRDEADRRADGGRVCYEFYFGVIRSYLKNTLSLLKMPTPIILRYF